MSREEIQDDKQVPVRASTLFVDILVSPGQACDRILLRRRSALVPYVALMLAFAALWAVYYFQVDFPWLIDRMVDGAMNRAGPGVTRDAVQDRMNDLNPALMYGIVVFSGVMSISMILLMRAVYMMVVAKLFAPEPPSLVGWASLSIWASVPTVVSLLVSFAYVLSNNVATMMPEEVSVSSLNRLFLRLPDTSPWAGLAVSFDIFLLWNSFIMGVGFSRWTKCSFLAGQAIAIAPFAMIYGIWALFILF